MIAQGRYFLARGKKVLGGILGAATGAGVSGLLALLGVEVDLNTAGAIALVLSWVGTFLAPENTPKKT